MATGRSRRALRIRALGAVTGAAAVFAATFAIGGEEGPAQRPHARPLPAAVSAAGLLERAGVRVVAAATTGGGGLLDVRFQVVDPGRAAAVHDPATPPAVVDEKTGAVIGRLLMDHMPHGPAKAGLTYYLVFENPGHLVRPGDEIGVVLGGARLAHVRAR